MAKAQRNRLIFATIGLLVIIVGVSVLCILDTGPISILPAFLQVEEEWDPIAAGDRIEEATGVDVLHVGPLGGYPKREEIAPIVMAAAEAYFGAANPTEEADIREDLGADDEMLVEFASLVGEAVEATTRYSGYISQNGVVKEVETLGDMIDYITDRFIASIGWLGATPRFHVSIIYNGVDVSGSGLAIAIVGYDNGEPIYQILEPGEYVWDESIGTDEDVRLQWNFWTWEKYSWYVERGGLFPPGKAQIVMAAVEELRVQIAIRELWRPLFNAILHEAYYYEHVAGQKFWRLIEIDYLSLGPANMAPGVDQNGNAGYVAYLVPRIIGSRYIFRAKASFEYIDERHEYKTLDYYLDRIFVAKGRELTPEEVYDIFMDSYKSQYQPGITIWGQMPYVYGYNHPWRADDMPS